MDFKQHFTEETVYTDSINKEWHSHSFGGADDVEKESYCLKLFPDGAANLTRQYYKYVQQDCISYTNENNSYTHTGSYRIVRDDQEIREISLEFTKLSQIERKAYGDGTEKKKEIDENLSCSFIERKTLNRKGFIDILNKNFPDNSEVISTNNQ
jgi:hypothetical protein